jgi:hypothetical protein
MDEGLISTQSLHTLLRVGLGVTGWCGGFFLAEKEAVQGEFVVLIGGECGGDDEDVDADEEDFRVIRQGSEADSEGEEDEAAKEEAEATGEADDGPESTDEEEVAEGFGVEVTEVLWEEAVVVGDVGDALHFFLVVVQVEGGVVTVAFAEFIQACKQEAETDPEAEQEVGKCEVPVAGG